MAQQVYLGIDLGAESGRGIAGLCDGKSIQLEEIHRFANGGVMLAETLRGNTVGGGSRSKLLGQARPHGEPGLHEPADVDAWYQARGRFATLCQPKPA